jgi:hypothetical protein
MKTTIATAGAVIIVVLLSVLFLGTRKQTGRFQIYPQMIANTPNREEGTILLDTTTGETWMVCALLKWCPMFYQEGKGQPEPLR